MELIFVYGPPGVGKLTVATELSRITGYYVFHNHIAIDLVKSIYGAQGSKTEEMIRAVNLAAIATAAELEKGMIFTYARPNDFGFISRAVELTENSGGIVIFVGLKCNEKTLLKRIRLRKDSKFSKISHRDALEEFRKVHGPFKSISARHGMVIDTSTLTAKEVAARISKELPAASR